MEGTRVDLVSVELPASGTLRSTPATTLAKLQDDFTAAWNKVMNADRFDLARK